MVSAAVVTGASTGIGRATAGRLKDAGFVVYATARRSTALSELDGEGFMARHLEVTDEAQCQALVAEVESDHGSVTVLVNNAGYSLQKPVEQATLSEARAQFETNVFGPMRLIQLVLPGMRRHSSGRIINVSSMGGRFTLPGGGVYHASKYAIEALTDALRLEVAAFGVEVVLVEPGVVQSEFGQSAATSDLLGDQTSADPYAVFNAKLNAALSNAYSGNTGRFDPSVNDVARVIVKAATTRRPRARYVVGAKARVVVNGRRLLPDPLWDQVIRSSWPSN